MCVDRWVSAENKLAVLSCRPGGFGRTKTQMSVCPNPCEHSMAWAGPCVTSAPPGRCRWPPGHARGTDVWGNERGFGGLQERAAVKGYWGPGLMESGQLGGRSRLMDPAGERRPTAAVVHQVSGSRLDDSAPLAMSADISIVMAAGREVLPALVSRGQGCC